MRIAQIASLLLLASCGSQGSVSMYRHFDDRFKARTNGLFGYPCLNPSKTEKEVLEPIPDRECYRFNAPKRMRGTWFDDFESSAFYPEGSTIAPNGTWLKDDPELSVFSFHRGGPTNKTYAIDFIGSKTSVPGSYGHMGASREMVLAERLISLREVKRPIEGQVAYTH